MMFGTAGAGVAITTRSGGCGSASTFLTLKSPVAAVLCYSSRGKDGDTARETA